MTLFIYTILTLSGIAILALTATVEWYRRQWMAERDKPGRYHRLMGSTDIYDSQTGSFYMQRLDTEL